MTGQHTPVVPRLVLPGDLHGLVRRIFQDLGSLEMEAQLVADHLVAADLTGHDSHGVGMIPRYYESLQTGGLYLNRHATKPPAASWPCAIEVAPLV